MAAKVHTARATLKSLDLSRSNSGISIEVHWDDEDFGKEKVGTLDIGYGGLHWRAGKKQTTKYVSWDKLNRLLYY